MAAEDEGKTEEPTSKKRSQARQEGNVAKSQDLGASATVLMGVIMLWFLGSGIREYIGSSMCRFIGEEMAFSEVPDGKDVMPTLLLALKYIFLSVAPFLAVVFVVAVGVNIYQVGLEVSFKPLEPDITKFNPVKGFEKLFSAKNFVMLGQNLMKLFLVIAVTWPMMAEVFGDAGWLTFLMPRQSVSYSVEKIWELALKISIVLFALSLFDLWYQRYKHEDGLKMTKEEVKDEMRSMEGDPQVKSKRRQKMMELAQQRMMQEIPDAEVVVRNPTHYAVALKYDVEEQLPTVVAKGKDNVALRIIELAKDAGVPTWQEPWLARKLFDLEIGDPIPQELYQSVATILAHVLDTEKKAQLRNARQGAA